MASSVIVPVIEIKNVREHPNASMLGLADVLGFQVVVGLVEDSDGNIIRTFVSGERDEKGSRVPYEEGNNCISEDVSFRFRYQDGDRAVYFPADTIIPSELAERLNVTHLLGGKEKNRVKRVALRGEPSFGLLVEVPEDIDCEIGDNLAEYFGAKKYEPPFCSQVSDAAKYDEKIDPLVQKYTDIENGRLHMDIFNSGEEVVVTEKIHGCFPHNTRILMSDGSKRHISKIKNGDKILGVDDKGQLQESIVYKTFRNDKSSEWLNVRGKRKGAGKGNSFYSVTCTPEHKFWKSGKGWVSANKLNKNDKLLLVRYGYDLRPVQKQILLGKLLGDGDLVVQGASAAIRFSHKIEHESYVDWTNKALLGLCTKEKIMKISGFGTTMISSRTLFTPLIKEYLEDFIKSDKKTIPEWIVGDITPIAIAFWYMDDGFLNDNGKGAEVHSGFSTCAFSKKDLIILDHALSKFGVRSTIDNKNKIIRLNSDNSERLFLLIAPYIPPIMQYKLPQRYRGHDGWVPTDISEYKPWLIEENIDNIVKITNTKYKYDLETETHNYFANGVLVHNSNCKSGIVKDVDVFSGSMTVRRKRPIGKDGNPAFFDAKEIRRNIYWYPWSMDGVQNLINMLASDHQVVTLYGEVFGGSIQGGMNYGVPKGQGLGFRAFDLAVDGKYLDWEDFASVCETYGVPMVPVLYRGPFSLAKIKELTEGNSVLDGADHIKEGVVVKPIEERRDPKIGRVVLKYISTAYDLSKHKKKDTTDI